MTLTRIVTVFIFAVLAADYSHGGCDHQILSMCSQKIYFSPGSENWKDYNFICRSDIIGYVKCAFDEGRPCGIFNEYFTMLGVSSWSQIEENCTRAGHPISQNADAAKQTLPSAMIIMGLLTALLVRTFPL